MEFSSSCVVMLYIVFNESPLWLEEMAFIAGIRKYGKVRCLITNSNFEMQKQTTKWKKYNEINRVCYV